ncbi:hypothetical protein Rsub_01649 [Raphidocelis subcapitata]|uniref:Tyrosine-protein kinase ephrin type A/B receptor-like domain-containing protein n=1 Tax=Raphidocelis subcapitata TaxID=307507 RepID=A0A2V0NMK3_9CHLO|nr:hypothetical protein Rsub_01649 [Raphidocelis subcapitata]|eukprot:GBF88748.1 hypothetical protein Rsub_01649 [Raphidocelis subcapitata]
MHSRLVLLLCLAGLAGVAVATRDLSADGRGLLQTEADCKRSIDFCSTCRYAFLHGTVTKAICLSCDTGYIVAEEGRKCWCAPGYFWNTTACNPCGTDNYCAGSVSALGDAAQNACGTNKITTTDYAKSDKECVAKPGYAWADGNGSDVCPAGSYNPGYNTRDCTKCPGGLTTVANTSTSTADCKAPGGSYYLRGRAIACAQGTYKAAIANADCDECSASSPGLTTKFGEVGKLAISDCAVIKPGYGAAASQVAGAIATVICPGDTYRVGEVDYDAAGVNCTMCGTGSKTLPNVEGATSPDACLAPPGWGWNSVDGTSTECIEGEYNPGWNREACSSCGSGTITTKAKGSVSPDQCFTPAGNGNSRSADGLTLTGFVCPENTYGRGTDTFGLVDVECTKCMEHTSTVGVNATIDVSFCVADAGYGYYDGEVKLCDYAFYSSAGGRDACEYCGMGKNTTDDGTVGIQGASANTQCHNAAGWEVDDAGTGVQQCLRGYYKPTIAEVACTKCLDGTTTSLMAGAILESDCDTCRPGFGILGSVVDVTAPLCDMCTSGKYSAGYTPGGQECLTCPNPPSFSGLMVSRNGIRTPEDCVGEFVSDGATTTLEWDVIEMAPAVFTDDAAASVEDCQLACHDSALGCQYFEFRAYASAGSQCKLRLTGADIAKLAFAGEDAPATSLLFLEVKESLYTVYDAADAADATSVGATITASSSATFAAVRASCNGDLSCVGFSWNTTHWRTFAGVKWEGAIGKVRVVGETLNSWIAEPISN